MSKRFDPYLEWLQVHSKSARPTHYELLGVSPSESDATVFQDAAKAQLKKLESVQPGSRKKMLANLIKEVRRSERVLSDSVSRTDYDQLLLNKMIKESDINPPVRGKANEQATTGAKPIRRAKVISTQVPMASPITAADPPMAKPVAKPVSNPAVKPSRKSAPPSIKPVESIPAIKPARSEERPKKETVQPPKRTGPPQRLSHLRPAAKKTNPLFAVIGLLVAGVAIAAFGYLVKEYIAIEEPADLNNATLADNTQVEKSANPVTNTSPEVASEKVETLSPEREEEPKEEVEQPLAMNDNDLKDETSPNKVEEPEDWVNPFGPDSADDPKIATTPPPAQTPATQAPETIDDLVAGLKDLPLTQQYELKNQFYDAKNLWRQQRFENANTVASEIKANSAQLAGAVSETSNQLRAFWEHFATSCEQHPDRQIVVGEKVVGLVEARPNEVILRIAGTNRTYEHRFVPPGLIMAIADRVADPNDGSYHLKKAAYYISQLSERPTFSERVDELLTKGEAAGEDVSKLRLMAAIKFWELGESVSKSERAKYKTDRALSDGVKETFNLKTPKRTRPPQAFELMRQIFHAAAEQSDGTHFGLSDQPDAQEKRKRRMLMLETAREYGIRGGYTPATLDIVNEICSISDADRDSLLFKTLKNLSNTAGLDSEHAKLYCDEILKVVRNSSSPYSARELKELCIAGIKVAERQNLGAFGLQLVNRLNAFSN